MTTIKELVKEALDELIAENRIIIETPEGAKVEDLVLNVLQDEDDEDYEPVAEEVYPDSEESED